MEFMKSSSLLRRQARLYRWSPPAPMLRLGCCCFWHCCRCRCWCCYSDCQRGRWGTMHRYIG